MEGFVLRNTHHVSRMMASKSNLENVPLWKGTLSRRDLLKWVGVSLGWFPILFNLDAKEVRMDAENSDQTVQTLEGLEYVMVTPEGPKDGGHFGRHTPGTKTSGIQEAFDHAKANRKDIYIVGGAMPKQFTAGAHYQLDETLRIPWMQDFRLDGGEYNLSYTKPTGYAIIIDSQMNCRYKFGKVISSSKNGGVIWFKPETKGPDNFSVVTASIFEFGLVLGGGGAWPGEGVKGGGNGIFLDSSSGGIHYNRIFSMEVVGCDKGVYLKGDRVHNNEIQVIFSHINTTHLQIGDAEATPTSNRITMDMIDSEGIPGSIGVDLFGQKNLLTVNAVRTAENKNIIFEAEAKDNLILAMNLPNGITNHAATPTNRIIPCWSVGFNIPTPAFPASGDTSVNRQPYPVEILILTPGTVSDWRLTDANGKTQSVSAGLSAGQRFVLEPGDRIQFTYTTVAPTWRWRALS